MSIDYVEELLQSIDTVVSARLGDLAYDRTIICTIVDSSKREYGKYTVTDGSMTFDAYSDNNKYSDNMQVQVVIPGGDWAQQKTIIGRCATEDIPIIYRSPTSKIANLSGNLVDRTKMYELAASGVEEVDGKECRISTPIEKLNVTEYETFKYDTLCIKGDFRSWLADYNITSGNYGVGVIINVGKKNEQTLTLNSAEDMFGAVYNFVDWVSQEQAFAIPKDIEKIETLDFYFYQDGKFAYINENGDNTALIPFDNGAGVFMPNLFVQNLEIYLGSETARAGVEIYSTGSLIYRPQDTVRVVKLLWNDKDAKDNEDPLAGIEEIQWFVDDSKGIMQQKSTPTKKDTEITINCYTSLTHVNVQAKVIRAENSIDNKAIYESNTLTFNNYIEKTNVIPNTDIKLRIVNKDNTLDSYTCYNDNYEIFKKESNIIRTIAVEWMSTSGSIKNDFWKNAAIEWGLPTENTMLTKVVKENTATSKQENTTSWQILKINNQDCLFNYKIADKYSENNKNNKITCKVTIPSEDKDENIVFELEKNISFNYQYLKEEEEAPPKVIIQDIADEKISSNNKTYVDGLTYLNQQKTFDKLTNYGSAQGVLKDTNGNLYINGSYIATGILRSNNWGGQLTVKYTNNEGEEVTQKFKSEKDAQDFIADKNNANVLGTGEWTMEATSGTYWDLNEGKLFASTFELNAWDDTDKKGLYINNNPDTEKGQSYFTIGNENSGNFIDYNANGNMIIQTNSKFVLNAWDGPDEKGFYQGVYLNSNPNNTDGGIYFRAGSANKDVEVNQKELVAENLIQVDSDGVFIAAKKFLLDAYSDSGIYIDNEATNGYYFQVGTDNGSHIKYNKDGKLIIKGVLQFEDGKTPVDQDQLNVLDEKFENLNNAFDALDVPTDTKISETAWVAVNTAVEQYLGAQGTTVITPTYTISPYIAGGYLHIANGNNSVTIDPKGLKNGLIFDVKKGGSTVIGFDSNGNATFSGNIYANSGTIGGWTINSTYGIGGAVDTGSGIFGAGLRFAEVFKKGQNWDPNKVCFAIGNIPYGFGNANTDWDSAAFRVTGNGHMTAKSGTISGWTFNNRYFYKNQNGQAIAFDFNALGQTYNTDSRVLGIGSFTVNPNATGGAADWGDNVYFSVDTYGRVTIKDKNLWSNYKTKVRIDGTKMAFVNNNDAMLFGLYYNSSMNMGIVSLGAYTSIYESDKCIAIYTDGALKKLKWLKSGSYTYLIGE